MEQNTPKSPKQKVSFSGIQPSGAIQLGNYIGALRNWIRLQDEMRCIYCVVDLHAITVRQDPKALRENTLRSYALLMACGIDANKSTLFIQSHVSAHAELAWVLSCFASYGELGRMTQFKDKSAQHADNINAGLFSYPVLMAADILAYQADMVPVGADQKQHLELTRNIAQRFNSLHGKVFTVPEPYIPQSGARVMSLAEPTKKMSKSDPNPKAVVAVLDSRDVIVKKFKSAVTDSEAEIVWREGKDGINNLISIYSAVTGKTVAEIETEFAGQGYGGFKMAVGETVADHLQPIRQEYDRLMQDKAYLEHCYRKGAEDAERIAARTMQKVYKKLGLVAK